MDSLEFEQLTGLQNLLAKNNMDFEPNEFKEDAKETKETEETPEEFEEDEV